MGTSVVCEVLVKLLDVLEHELIEDEQPSPLRVQLRVLKGMLGAYAPVSEVDMLQQLAEEDGDEVEDAP